MKTAAQILASGVLFSIDYALVAAGLTLIFRTSRILNLSHGVFVALGAYCAFEATRFGLPALAGAAPAAASGLLLGMLVECSVVRRVRSHPLTAAIVLLGLAFAAEAGFALAWGRQPRSVPFQQPPLLIHGVVIGPEELAASAVACGIILAMLLVLRTRAGLAVRAAAADPEIAVLAGIDTGRVRTTVFGAACAMAAIAGALLSPLSTLVPTMGRLPLVLSCAIIVVGGPGRLGGALAASLGVGLAATVTGHYALPQWTYIAGLWLVIAVTASRASPAWSARGP